MGGCFRSFGPSNKGSSEGVWGRRVSCSISPSRQDQFRQIEASKWHYPKKYPPVSKDGSTAHIATQIFTFCELANAMKNFRQECLLGEGGLGRVPKGQLDSTGQIGQVVVVKQLDRNGLQGNREFLVEVFMLSLLHHSNLVNLIGYCADGDQRLLV